MRPNGPTEALLCVARAAPPVGIRRGPTPIGTGKPNGDGAVQHAPKRIRLAAGVSEIGDASACLTHDPFSMSPSILVVGATGTVGSALVQMLVDRGVPLRAFVRDRAPHLHHPLVHRAQGDLQHPDSIDAALHGISRVFLLSPLAPDQVTLQGHVVEAAQRTGRRIHLVKASCHGAGPATPLRFARWHAVTEAQIKSAGLPATMLRPCSFMQNLLGATPAHPNESILYGAFGDAALPFIDGRDVAAVAAEVLTGEGHEGRTYTLTGPEALTYTEVAATLARVLRRSFTYVDLPPERYRALLRAGGAPDWRADGQAELAQSFRAGAVPTPTPTVHRLTGRPARSLRRFVHDYADAFRPPARTAA